MRFWDTSAVVSLLVAEAGTRTVRGMVEDDPELVVWWGTRVECASALARYAREHDMPEEQLVRAGERLAAFAGHWSEIVPSAVAQTTAERIARTHALGACGAMQLAAALVASDGQPGSVPFVSLDARQREAARREGCVVVPDVVPSVGAGREGGRG